MQKEFFKHKWAYSILLLGLSLFTFYFFAAWPNRIFQRILVVAFAVFYFVWGVITHVKAKQINQRLVMEYLTISLLVGVLLFLVTL